MLNEIKFTKTIKWKCFMREAKKKHTRRKMCSKRPAQSIHLTFWNFINFYYYRCVRLAHMSYTVASFFFPSFLLVRTPAARSSHAKNTKWQAETRKHEMFMGLNVFWKNKRRIIIMSFVSSTRLYASKELKRTSSIYLHTEQQCQLADTSVFVCSNFCCFASARCTDKIYSYQN